MRGRRIDPAARAEAWGDARGRAAVLAAALALAPLATPAPGQSLADALVAAYRNSPELQSQRANVKVAAEQAVQARAEGRLQVEGNAALEAELDDFDDVQYPTTLSITATQPLYTGGQVANATEAAERRITAQEALLIATEQDLLLNAVTAYSDVLRDIAFVDLGINNVRVLSEQLRAATERFEVGEVTRTDVEQARARLAAAQSSLAAARGSLEVSRQTYARVVGEPPGELQPTPPIPQLPNDLTEAVRIAMENEPNLVAARIQRDASGFDVRAAIGALLPQVTLQGQVSRNEILSDENGGFSGANSASVGLAVTVPFYTSGLLQSGIREAQAGVESSIAGITSAQRVAVEQVSVSWSDLEVARARIASGVLEVEAAELAFLGVSEEAKVGARTTLDVLDAEQELLEARASLVDARRDEYVAGYQVLFSIGKLTVTHLGLEIAPDLSANTYYTSVRDRNFGYDESEDTVWSKAWRP